MSNDREIWERRYAESPPRQLEASTFLREFAHLVSGRVLDLAAGSGRNSLFLARLGHQVDAIDIAAHALRSIRTIADHESLTINTIQADFSHFPLPVAAYDTILNFRYLQRSLFDPIQESLRPAGILLFETFLSDQATIGHPRNPDFLLTPGELQRAFPKLQTVFYSEGLSEDGEKPAFLARLCARQPWA